MIPLAWWWSRSGAVWLAWIIRRNESLESSEPEELRLCPLLALPDRARPASPLSLLLSSDSATPLLSSLASSIGASWAQTAQLAIRRGALIVIVWRGVVNESCWRIRTGSDGRRDELGVGDDMPSQEAPSRLEYGIDFALCSAKSLPFPCLVSPTEITRLALLGLDLVQCHWHCHIMISLDERMLKYNDWLCISYGT